MRRAVRSVVLVAVFAGLVGPTAACGSSQDVEPRGDLTLDDARAFDDFPLVFAGDRVDELPLVAVLRRSDTASYVSFVYGDCLPTAYDQGCAPPAEIQVWPAAARGLGSYDRSSAWAPGVETTTVRGVPAAFVGGDDQLELYLDHSTVVIFSHPRQRVLDIAQALRCVSDAGSTPSTGTLEC